VGEARIIVSALYLVLEQQLGVLGRRIGIAGIEKQRLAGLVERRALTASVNHLCRGGALARIKEGVLGFGHSSRLQQKNRRARAAGSTVFSYLFKVAASDRPNRHCGRDLTVIALPRQSQWWRRTFAFARGERSLLYRIDGAP